MRLEGGEVGVKGKLAYVAQSAWVPNDSLRNAVLFGQSLDRTKYAHTLQACGLLPDLALLEVRGERDGGLRRVGVGSRGLDAAELKQVCVVYLDVSLYSLCCVLANVVGRCDGGGGAWCDVEWGPEAAPRPRTGRLSRRRCLPPR